MKLLSEEEDEEETKIILTCPLRLELTSI